MSKALNIPMGDKLHWSSYEWASVHGALATLFKLGLCHWTIPAYACNNWIVAERLEANL